MCCLLKNSHFCTKWHDVSKYFKHGSCFETVILVSSLFVNFQVRALTLMFVKRLTAS